MSFCCLSFIKNIHLIFQMIYLLLIYPVLEYFIWVNFGNWTGKSEFDIYQSFCIKICSNFAMSLLCSSKCLTWMQKVTTLISGGWNYFNFELGIFYRNKKLYKYLSLWWAGFKTRAIEPFENINPKFRNRLVCWPGANLIILLCVC